MASTFADYPVCGPLITVFSRTPSLPLRSFHRLNRSIPYPRAAGMKSRSVASHLLPFTPQKQTLRRASE